MAPPWPPPIGGVPPLGGKRRVPALYSYVLHISFALILTGVTTLAIAKTCKGDLLNTILAMFAPQSHTFHGKLCILNHTQQSKKHTVEKCRLNLTKEVVLLKNCFFRKNTEGSPSGLWRRLGKAVCGQLHRGFESLSLRQLKEAAERRLLLVDSGKEV